MAQKTFVSELKEGQLVDSAFSVKYKRGVAEYGNGKGWYFSIGASDKTGEIEVTYWGGASREAVQKVHDSVKEGGVARVQGIVGNWKDRKKIDVNEGKGTISQAAFFNPEDFLPRGEKDVEEMYAKLLQLVDGIKDNGTRKLLNAFFRDEEFAETFKRAPAAMQLHHAWLGGLLEHSLNVATTCKTVAGNYDGINEDLLVAGALLHDVGKLHEYEVTTSIKVSEAGMLRGHVVMGEEMVRAKAGNLPELGETTLLKLSHILLSHHGEGDKGAPKKPMIVEAALVHYADEMDAKASQFARIRKETTSEDFRVYDKHWGEVYLK